MSNEEIILDENMDGNANQPSELNMASTGQRFATYLIDMLAFYAIAFVFGGAAGFIIAASDGGIVDSGFELIIQLIALIGFSLYYIIMEGATGKTLGKYVAGTMVVYANGQKPNYRSALTRTLSRIVPFEVFTAFSSSGRMWHDSWTNTFVIRTR